jgi:hypothetical protein
MEAINPKTQLTHAEAREFIREHFEEFVNKKNLQIGHVNFAPDFVFLLEYLQALPAQLNMSTEPCSVSPTCMCKLKT